MITQTEILQAEMWMKWFRTSTAKNVLLECTEDFVKRTV